MIVQPYPDVVLKAVNSVFNCCPTVIKNDLLNHLTIKSVKKDEVFIQEGDCCDGIYIISKGSIKLYLKKTRQNDSRPNGIAGRTSGRKKRDQIILFKTVNDIIGIQSAMSDDNFNYSASAMEDSMLAFIPKTHIEKILTTYPNVFFSLMKKVNETATAIESRSSLMMSDSAEKVVMKTMQDLKNTFGTDDEGYIKIQIPVKDLASYICMSKTNLYRVLHALKGKTGLSHQLDRYRLS